MKIPVIPLPLSRRRGSNTPTPPSSLLQGQTSEESSSASSGQHHRGRRNSSTPSVLVRKGQDNPTPVRSKSQRSLRSSAPTTGSGGTSSGLRSSKPRDIVKVPSAGEQQRHLPDSDEDSAADRPLLRKSDESGGNGKKRKEKKSRAKSRGLDKWQDMLSEEDRRQLEAAVTGTISPSSSCPASPRAARPMRRSAGAAEGKRVTDATSPAKTGAGASEEVESGDDPLGVCSPRWVEDAADESVKKNRAGAQIHAIASLYAANPKLFE